MSAPRPAPVFIHANRRTGGTAWAAALRREPGIRLFFDPFNMAFAHDWSSMREIGPGTWESRHPADMGPYFAEYAPLVDDGRVRGASTAFHDRYVMDAETRDDAQEAFLRSLIDLAHAAGDRPVLKTEQTEGRLGWLRARFPHALHIGLLRHPDAQFASWVEQLLRGNAGFCEAAHRTVADNPAFFGSRRPLGAFDAADWDAITHVFHRWHAVTHPIRRDDTDLALDLSPESTEDLAAQRHAIEALIGPGSAPFTHALTLTRADAPTPPARPPGREFLRRVHATVIPLRARLQHLEAAVAAMAERERERERVDAELRSLAAAHAAMSTAHAALAEQARAIQAELDAARARERDLAERAAHTARELDRMASSRSWRITAPIRRLGGMMRPPGR